LINFDSVSFVHQDQRKALDNVCLTIDRGDLVAIVGGNGAGKTTLIKHVNGLLKPTTGTVTVDGVDTRKESVAELSRRVGIVFQNSNHQLFADTVENEIIFGLNNLKFSESTAKQRVDWALETFELQTYRSQSPMTLSGGEKKRLCIALVLAWNPEVLILDEPTVGQDQLQKEKLTAIIRMLISQHRTVIVVSHDLEFIWPLQPRMVVMSNSRIIADGACQEVFADFQMINKARLQTPQLCKLQQSLSPSQDEIFTDVHDAKRYIQRLRSG
jgi:energy-coupling factor transport system ATP-binding protein